MVRIVPAWTSSPNNSAHPDTRLVPASITKRVAPAVDQLGEPVGVGVLRAAAA
jgi:hypothetical protein